jgi:hypothetical protein
VWTLPSVPRILKEVAARAVGEPSRSTITKIAKIDIASFLGVFNFLIDSHQMLLLRLTGISSNLN